ncbi:hypothetical protein K2Q16_01705 [Patescibacteria group bacterium]|nr:hypothetical protein [Patescibacteria group bacterium]
MTQAHPIVLSLSLECEQENLPAQYWKALSPHLASTPESFYLRWPSSILPQVGQDIRLYNLHVDEWKVREVCHDFRENNNNFELITFIQAESVADKSLTVSDLLELAHMGFSLRSDENDVEYKLAEILRRAGLPTNPQEYEVSIQE